MTKEVFSEWTTPPKLALIQSWRRDGDRIQDVADKIGIDRVTLQTWAKRDKKVRIALDVGKREAIAMVRNTLFKQAMKGDMKAIDTWAKRNDPDWSTKEDKARIDKMRAEADIARFTADALRKGEINNPIAEALAKIANGDQTFVAEEPRKIEDVLKDDKIQQETTE